MAKALAKMGHRKARGVDNLSVESYNRITLEFRIDVNALLRYNNPDQ